MVHKPHPSKDVVILCNPQAGGRWRALADVLDSEEAASVRRIVTDEIDDLHGAISGLGQRVKLLCIYGGDGTIFRVIQELFSQRAQEGELSAPPMALLGGGTMNVTARWCGMGGSPGDNFRRVMQAFRSDRLLFREIPLLEVRTGGGQISYGFTCGAGPLIRILARYEQGDKGHLGALTLGVKSIAAAVTRFPGSYRDMLKEMSARVLVDGKELPYSRFSALFANVTGAINPLIEPFATARTRESFHFLAYAVSSREFALMAPLLARAKVPIDRRGLFRRASPASWKQAGMALLGKATAPLDPRYVNHPAQKLQIFTEEEHYTIDGEVLPIIGGSLEISLGPTMRLALVDGD